MTASRTKTSTPEEERTGKPAGRGQDPDPAHSGNKPGEPRGSSGDKPQKQPQE